MNANPITRAILSQLMAGLSTMKDCVGRCPDAEWDEDHGDYPFCQVVFHTLFDTDYHLCDDDAEFATQAFHRRNPQVFGDYTGLEDLLPRRLYSRDFVLAYYEHCRSKAIAKITPRTIEELSAPRADVRRNMTRLERYVNVVRHVQHHTAQLALTLQLLTGQETEWISWEYE